MYSFTSRIFIYFFTLLFLVATGWYAYSEEILVLVIPFALLLAIILIQYPEILLYLLLLVIPWSVEYNFPNGLGTDLPDEPMMLLMALAAIILVIKKWRKPLIVKAFHPVLLLVGIQLLWTVATVITSTEFVLSLKFVLAKGWYLLAFVLMPLYLFRDEKIMKRAFLLLMVSMLSFMFVALYRHYLNQWTFEKINESLQPFFRNHVNYSALLVCMVPLLITFIQVSRSSWVKNFLILLIVITSVAIYFSYARGAWLALVTGSIAYWLIKKRWLFKSYLLFVFLSVGAVIWLIGNERYMNFSHDYRSTIFHTNFRDHLIATYQMKDVSTAERFHRWVGGVRMIGDSWKTGLGPSSFYRQYKSYTLPAFKTWVSKNPEQSTVHNYFLLQIIEQGVLGLLLFLALLGSLFWYTQKIYHRTRDKFLKVFVASMAAIFVMISTVNFLSDLIETDKVGGLFYLCLTAVVMADIRSREGSADSKAV